MAEHNDNETRPTWCCTRCAARWRLVTMNRPEFHNAQNSQMTYALDAAFRRACDDDDVKVIVLRGAGKHFSAGHDIGTPGRDVDKTFDRATCGTTM